MTPEDWQKLKQEMQFKPTLLDVGFPDKSPQSVGGEREVLPTHKSYHRIKVEVPMEDYSHLNAPHTERLQRQVKEMWARMTPEQREEERRKRRENALRCNGKKRVKY